MNINNELIDFNLGDLNSMLEKENLVALLLKSPTCNKSNLPIKVEHLYSNFDDIRESILGYLYTLRYFNTPSNDTHFKEFTQSLKNTLSFSNKNRFGHSVLPRNISFRKLLSNSGKEPFSITENNVYHMSEFRELVKIFAHDFIHSKVIDIICNPPDCEDEVELYDENDATNVLFDAMFDELSYSSMHKELYSYVPNLNILDKYEEETLLELCCRGFLAIKYITCSSKELSNYIKCNLDNQDALNHMLHISHTLLPYYVESIVCLSTPVIIDNTSIFHDKGEDFNLLFAVTIDYSRDSEFADYSAAEIKEFGIHVDNAWKCLNNF